jgi:hypothetical protein
MRTEGGMDYDTYGDAVDTLPEALVLLSLANKGFATQDWEICCEVDTQVADKNKKEQNI